MYIEEHQDVIKACRFCFMCRHLDPVGNVTFREADTPRGRALILDRVRMEAANLKNADFIATMYRSALSAANRYHCVSHYDETGLVLAARRDIVAAGLAPENAKKLAEELAKATFAVKGKGESLYFGHHPELYPECAVVSGKDPGKALEVLGFIEESRRVLETFKQAIAGAKARTLIVAEPAAYDFLKDKLEGTRVVHSSEYLLARDIKAGPSRKAYFLESDFLKNYGGNPPGSRELLKRCGYELVPFGTNGEESYAAGEGAVVFDELNPDLCRKLCRRVYDLADNPAADLFVTPSTYTASTLKKYNASIRILSLEEAFALRKEI